MKKWCVSMAIGLCCTANEFAAKPGGAGHCRPSPTTQTLHCRRRPTVPGTAGFGCEFIRRYLGNIALNPKYSATVNTNTKTPA